MTALIVILIYLLVLLGLGVVSSRLFRKTSEDFFLASRSIGPFMLLMSLFGTTMTAFALVGSTAKAYTHGIGVYGMMASWSGLIHSAIFFFIGLKLWDLGRRYGYVTQVQFFRDRFGRDALGTLLFPILVLLVVPYLLIGLLGAGFTVTAVTRGTLPQFFGDGGVPHWLTAGVICMVVYSYVFLGGLRAAAWANAFQTTVFVIVGLVAFTVIANGLGGLEAASAAANPERLIRGSEIGQLQFFTYFFVPLSVAMFPHLFQHWLTAKSARTFQLPIVLHPVLIMIVWVPCILIGVWASGYLNLPPEKANIVLGVMVKKLTTPMMSGLVTAGILAAIMSSLDSQFLCLGTMFSQDVAFRVGGARSEQQKLRVARAFVGLVVLGTYLISLVATRSIFDLGVWCFSGFAGLSPLMIGALYWRRTTAQGAIACVITASTIWIALFLQSTGGENLVLGMMPVAFIVGGSTVALVVVSLLTPPPDEERLQRFFPANT